MTRISLTLRPLVFCLIALFAARCEAAALAATFTSTADTPLSVPSYTAAGNTVNLNLGFAPPVGSSLTVVRVTGLSFIEGRFDNLAQGQRIDLAFNGIRYPFFANYHGGSGNDLVLEWANVRAVTWGDNTYGQLGLDHQLNTRVPTAVVATGALAGKTILHLASGIDHTTALCSDGSLFAWGSGYYGQLGNNSEANSTVPVAVDRTGILAGKTVVSLAAGQGFNLALCSDGTLAFWGRNLSGAAGNGTFNVSLVPTAVDQSGVLAGKSVVAIAAGEFYCLALCSDGTLAAWGSNAAGQLGDGTTTSRSRPVAVAQTGALAGKSVTAIAAGAYHCYALCSDGTLAAWGVNGYGQLGNNTTTSSSVPVAVVRSGVLSGKTITSISAGGFFGMALCSDSTLACWGLNEYGQLGNNSTVQSRVPVAVVRSGVLAGKTITAANCGHGHCQALASDGTLAAWGVNYGRLGDDTITNRSVPVLVNSTALQAGERFNRLAPGGSAGHSAALVASPPPPGVLTQAASGVGDQRAILHGTANANGSAATLAFEYGTTAALGRTVVASPANLSGNVDSAASAEISGLLPHTTYFYRLVATSGGGTVAGETLTLTTGSAAALFGLTTPAAALTPAFQPAGNSYWITVPSGTAGISFTPTVAQAGATVTVAGIPAASGSASAEVPLAAGNNAIPIRVTSAEGTIAFTYTIHVTRLPATFAFDSATDLPATAVGFDLGGKSAEIALRHLPKPGTPLTLLQSTGLEFIRGSFSNLPQGEIVTLTHAGVDYTYVADYFGGNGNDLVLHWANVRPVSWGTNSYGELGDSSLTSRNAAGSVLSTGALAGRTLIATACGRDFSVALDSDGIAYSWGDNAAGMLGIGTTAPSTFPVKVTASGVLAGKRIVALAAGTSHVLALCSDGSLVAWGDNSRGQLGIGSTSNSSQPVMVDSSGVLAGKRVVQIAAGNAHSVALCGDGSVFAWGFNDNGQLGDGTLISRTRPVAVIRDGILKDRSVIRVVAGYRHSFALCADGTLAGWGMNHVGQLGDGTLLDRKVPVAAGLGGAMSGKSVVTLATGNFSLHTLALCNDGSIAGWGPNNSGELGNGTSGSSNPVPVAVNRSGVLAGRTVTAIATGSDYSLACCSDGSIAAWGSNSSGRLGIGTTSIGTPLPVLVNPTLAYPGTGFSPLRFGTGASHTVALLSFPPLPAASTLAATAIKDLGATLHGEVRANGNPATVSFEYGPTESYGAVVAAQPASVGGSAATPVQAAITGLIGGTTYHYRVIAAGAGGITYGESRTFTTTAAAALADLRAGGHALAPAFSPAVQNYAVTVPHAAASIVIDPRPLATDATVIVNGSPLASGGKLVSLAEGPNPVAIVVTSADGINARTYSLTVTRLPQTIRLLSAGAPPLALGKLDASGQSLGTELLFHPVTGSNLRLLDVAGYEPVTGRFDNLAQGQQVTLTFDGIDYPFVANYHGGDGNDLVLHWANNRLMGWGSNLQKALGIQSVDSVLLPTPPDSSALLAGKTIFSLAAGGSHSLALTSDGALVSVGSNSSGQLGNPAVSFLTSVPVAVDRSGVLAGKTVIAVAAGSEHSLALCSDGTVAAWGRNTSGQVGNGTTTQSIMVPVTVDRSGVLAGKRVAGIAAGSNHSLAWCSDGTVVAWGLNDAGQLGNGLKISSPVPVKVDSTGVLAGKTVSALAGSSAHSVALCTDGTLVTWGVNTQGQLGVGTTMAQALPVVVLSNGVLAGKKPVKITAGGSHSMALCQDGTLVAWGIGQQGELGNGGSSNSSVPVAVAMTGGLAGKTVVGIAAGYSHSSAYCSDGSAAAWGRGNLGQRGDGTTTFDVFSPAAVLASNLRTGERFSTVQGSAGYTSLAVVGSPPPPSPLTLAVTALRDKAATLKGAVRPNGSSTTLRFEYGLTAAYGNSLAASPATASGTGEVAASAPISGLLPGFTYHYRIIAESPGGTTYGEDRTFTTTTLGTLAGLGLSDGTLAPEFDLTRAAYVATVPAGVSNITVTPLASHPDASVRVNGVLTPSGTASQPLALATGSNPVTIQVTSGDGFNTMSYQVVVTRLPATFAFPSPASVPVTAADFTATGNAPPFLLGHAPQAGANLQVIDLTGSGPIRGRFDNLAQGQRVELEFGGVLHPFVANYRGGTGNDLVLEWGNTRVSSWGNNAAGQSGSGILNAPTLTAPTPVESGGVLAGKTLRSLHPGLNHVIALGLDDSLFSWGSNASGELGDGSTTSRTFPVAIPLTGALAGKSVVAVAAGSYHSLALCSDGSLAAWGSNGLGQLGNGTNNTSSTPVAVVSTGVLAGKTVVAIAAGTTHSLALCQDGTIASWGNNISAQLGTGNTISTSFSMVPVPVVSNGVLAGKRPVSIVAGHDFSLALCDDGNIAGWGTNSVGQLGNNSTGTSYVPVLVDRSGVLAGKSVIRLAVGSGHALALLSDGSLAAWGGNSDGALGDGSTTQRNVPVLVNRNGVLAGKQIVDVDAGGGHSIAVCADGSLATWGNNNLGQLGDGTTTNRSLPVLVPMTSLKPGERFIKGARLSRGNSSHALIASPPAATADSLAASAVTDTGAVLNATVRPNGSSATVWFEFGLTPFLGTTVAAVPATLAGTGVQPASHLLTNLTPGTAYHYRVVSSGPGGVSRGQIRSFTTTARATLAGLTSSAGVIGPDFDPKSTAYWLTVPAATQGISLTPVVAHPGATVTIAGSPVASGQAGPTVALLPGNNAVEVAVTSADGTATVTYHVTVTRVPEVLSFGSATDVPLRVSGFNAAGNPALTLGFSPSPGTDLMLVENTGRGFIRGAFEGLAQGTSLRLDHGGITYEFSVNYHGGDGNDLVLQWANMALFGWGDNGSGAAGHHGPTSYTPVAVADDRGVLARRTVSTLSTGSSHTLVLCTDGTLAAWGSNSYGQLGNGETSSSNVAVAVDLSGDLAGKTVVAIASGREHNLVLCSDGTVAAWGSNSLGQLGAWESTHSRTPVVLEKTGALSGRKVVAIRAGDYFNLALCEDGALAAWGYNDSGQLGDGTTDNRALPVLVGGNSILGGRPISSITAGGSHVLATCEDGSLLAWGSNALGQLGNGTTTNSPSPVPIITSGLLASKRVIALAAGSSHNLALCADGTLAAWGANGSGQLGNGSSTESQLPVAVNRSGVLAGKNIRGIAAHNSSSYAMCGDGSIAAWGLNQWGQLGDNTTTNRNQPVLVQTSILKPGERFIRLADGPSSNHLNAVAAGPARATVDTLAVVVTGDTTATLQAAVRANTAEAAVSFEYGTTPAFGQTAGATPAVLPAGTTAPIRAELAGLQGGTIYHYRAIATGAGGISYGESRTFTTGSAAALAALTAGDAVLSPSFSPAAGSYLTTVPFATARLTVAAQALSAAAEIRIHGSNPEPGSATAEVDLAIGNNPIVIEVSALQGTVTQRYSITVIRYPESIVYRDGSELPLVLERFPATGPAPALSLDFAPTPGTGLTLVRQTGLEPFTGRFDNLAQGQVIALSHGGVRYRFVANYYGGSGNDLVLEWANRRIVGWGKNSGGELGHAVLRDMSTPVATVADAFPTDGTLFAIDAAGTGNHTLALGSDGVVYAWGVNSFGQLGNGNTINGVVPAPVDRGGILAGKRVVRVAAGGAHNLALCDDGTLVAWGLNSNGQLGVGDTVHRSSPVAVDRSGVLAGKTIISIGASYYASFAACSDGTLAAWGGSGSGILGNGSTSGSFLRPITVFRGGILQGKTVVALAPGENHCFALCSDGTFVAWGQNTYGQLGNNSNADSPVPVLVERGGLLAGKTVVQASAGRAHGVAVCSDGTVAAWGRNNYGEVGNNTTTQSRVPIAISTSGSLAGKTVTAVDASIFNSLALCSDGSAAAWGYNPWGQLGNGTTTDSNVPVAVLPGMIRLGERMIAGAGAVGYHFALVASPPAPSAETLAATSVDDHGATLQGRAGANDRTTVLNFEYGLTDSYGSTISGDPATIEGTAATDASASLTGLLAGTTYHYRVVVSSDGGTTRGADFTFTTGTQATLAGLALNHGLVAPEVAPGRTNYSATVPFAVSSITVTPFVSSPGATVTVGGNPVSAGSASAAVELSVGANPIVIEVKEADGGPASQTHTLTVTRLPEIFAFATPGDEGARADHFDPEGIAAAISLGHPPATGAALTLLNNTGTELIRGSFANLAHGSIVTLAHGGVSYEFIANYHGGDGNDLVLQWANTRLVGWGNNRDGQLGDRVPELSRIPVPLALDSIPGTSPLLDFATGSRHSLALTPAGDIHAWGNDEYGQLGQPGFATSLRPLPVDRSGVLAGRRVISLAAGFFHSLALCDDGRVVTWGRNDSSQLGDGTKTNRDSPVLVDASGVLAGKRVVRIAAGLYHNLALCSDGTLAAWGWNNFGQLGNNRTVDSSVPVRVDTSGLLAGKRIVSLAAGYQHSLVLCSDGTLATWGGNNFGQLGIENTPIRTAPGAVLTTGALAGKSVTGIAASGSSCLVWCSDGTALGWGRNDAGALGDGSTTTRPVPTVVASSGFLAGKAIATLHAGSNHTVAQVRDGTAAAWGSNSNGELGDNNTNSSFIPVAVHTGNFAPGERIIDLACGPSSAHTLALVASPPGPSAVTGVAEGITGAAATLTGGVRPNGGEYGIAFEYGLTPDYGHRIDATPAAANGTGDIAASARIEGLISGANYHYRILATSPADTFAGEDRIFTVGDDAALASLGLSAGSFDQPFTAARLEYHATIPFSVSSLTVAAVPARAGAVVTINGGPGVTLAPPPGESLITVEVAALSGEPRQSYLIHLTRLPETFRFAAAGDVPLRSAKLSPAGLDASLELGFAPLPGTRLTVVENTGTGWIQGSFANLAQGETVAFDFGGRTYRFAANYFGGDGNDLVLEWASNRLFGWGYGTNPSSTRPTRTDPSGTIPASPVVQVAGGQGQRLTLHADGSLFAWGSNSFGQLGDGTRTSATLPVAVDRSGVLAGKQVIRIATGESHTLALCSDGTVAGWGDNREGAAGPAAASQQTVPAAIPVQELAPGKTIVGIAAGEQSSYAWFEDGTIAAWGLNQYGQLGDDSAFSSSSPVLVFQGGALAGKKVVSVVAGEQFAAALCTDGTVATWGRNDYGQLGNNSTTDSRIPVAVDHQGALAGKAVIALAPGSHFLLALCSDGSAAGWGRNTNRQLAHSAGNRSTVPTAVQMSGALEGKTIVEIAAGENHAWARCSDGSAVAWGSNSIGQLGNNSMVAADLPVTVDTANLLAGERLVSLQHSPFTSASYALAALPQAPVTTTLAATVVRNTSAVLNGRLFPDGVAGELHFDFGPTDRYGFTTIASPASVSAGDSIPASASVTDLPPGSTWHFRLRFVTPHGTYHGADSTFSTGTDATLVQLGSSAGSIHPGFAPRVTRYAITAPFPTSAITLQPIPDDAEATVTVNGSPAGTPLPLQVGPNDVVVQVTHPRTGETLSYLVVVTRLPEVLRLGSSSGPPLMVREFAADGALPPIELGFTPAAGSVLTLVENTGGNPIHGRFPNLPHAGTVDLESGGVAYRFAVNYHGGDGNDLVLQWANSRLFGWGDSINGQIGNGLKGFYSRPTLAGIGGAVAGKPILATAMGSYSSLALARDGSLAAWGSGAYGVLGNGTNTESLLPVAVDASGVLAGKTVVMMAPGRTFNVVLCDDGLLAAWGNNDRGQLGGGTATSSTIPLAVPANGALAGRRATTLAAGEGFVLARCSDGSLITWGTNGYGELGNNGRPSAAVPVLVASNTALAGKHVTAIAAGDSHCLVLCEDGSLAAWGLNDRGQLGDGSFINRAAPVAVDHGGALAGRRVVRIAAGNHHSLALCSDGTLVSWGHNANGQLGNNTQDNSSLPVEVERSSALAGKTVHSVVAGATGGFATCTDGSHVSWGANDRGQAGDGSNVQRLVPVEVTTTTLRPGERLMSLPTRHAGRHTVMLAGAPLASSTTLAASDITGTRATLQGTVQANRNAVTVSFEYGLDATYGESTAALPATAGGIGTTPASARLSGLRPGTTYHYRTVAEGTGGIVRGEDQTFTTLSDNALLAALNVNEGVLGPDFKPQITTYHVSVPAGTASVTVGPVTDHPRATFEVRDATAATVALTGQRTTVTITVTAEDRETLKQYTLIVTRLPETFVLNDDSSAPLTVDGFSARGYPARLSLNHAPVPGTILMVVRNTGLGFIHGTFNNLARGQRVALAFDGLEYDFVANYHGGDGNDLVLQWANTRAIGWGLNSYGQLGDGSTTRRLSPVATDESAILAGKTITAISGGYLHSLALLSDGSVASWGFSAQGQLGDGSTTTRSTPGPVDFSDAAGEVIAISAGPFHNLALRADGRIAAWGYNNHGQLGTGDKVTYLRPVLVPSAGALAGKQVVAVAAGTYQSFAVCSDGTVAAWGYNDEGELGDGTSTSTSVPVAVDTSGILAGKSVAKIAAGQYHLLALCTDGTLVSWGYNARGQLGNGTTVDARSPVAVDITGVLSGKSAVVLAAGDSHSLIRCSDGTVAAWGNNLRFQLGNGSTLASSVPVAVDLSGLPSGSVATSVGTGRNHNLMRLRDGTLAAWGENSSGQLGNLGTVAAARPAMVELASTPAGSRAMFEASGSAAQHSLAVLGLPGSRPAAPDTALAALAGNSGLDSDHDGISDLLELAFGLDPSVPHAGTLPRPQIVDGRLGVSFVSPAGVTGYIYGAECSETLEHGTWKAVPDSGSGTWHEFKIPVSQGPRMFMRLTFTRTEP